MSDGKKYDVLYIDVPWRYESGTTMKRWSIEEHYKTMTLDDIMSLRPMIDELAAPDCVLYLWTTAPKLLQACRVIEAWAFNYRSNLVWHKSGLGMGHWARIDHEHLLIAVRGKPGTPPDTALESSVFELQKGRHSEKPDYFRGYIERCFPQARRIELFARDKVPGWDVHGLEAPKFDTYLF